MLIVNRQGETINSIAAWEQLAPPASDKHWKEGRSAYELARAWSTGSAEQDVVALLTAHPDLAGLELERATAEKQTRFDAIPRGPRNHDLLVDGATPRGRVVIGVEGKADEPFDRTVQRYRQDGEAKAGSKAPERLDLLTRVLFGATDLEDPTIGKLGYQLLSAAAGTLADAREPEAIAAVLLVHEFVTSKTAEEKQQANAEALDAFVERLAGGGAPPRRIEDPGGWIAGPIRVHADSDQLPTSMLLYVGNLTTDVTAR